VGGVIALVICTLSFFIGTKVSATDSKDKQFIGAEKREISLSEGLNILQDLHIVMCLLFLQWKQ
jgi:hypothetical protein